MIKISDQEFAALTDFLKKNFGINMTKKRTLIEGRLNNYLLRNGFSEYGPYLKILFSDPSGPEVNNIINFLTTNYSYFMREWDHFEFYKGTILPQMKESIKNFDLRVWSAGCSTGEEPYMLAIITDEFFAQDRALWDKKILATDISEKVLNQARGGIYDVTSLEKVPPAWLRNYFDKRDKSSFQVKESLRKEVIFRRFNLMEPTFPFKKKFHMIFCRNVMIYFEADTKNKLIEKYYNALENGGYLIVGQSESVDRAVSRFRYVMPSVYRKMED